MLGLYRVNASLWVFLLNALLLGVVAVFAYPLYDWGTNLGRKLGHSRMVALRERMKPRILPPIRVVLIVMALISFVFFIVKLAQQGGFSPGL